MTIGGGAAFLLGREMEHPDQPTTENAPTLTEIQAAAEQVLQRAMAAQAWRTAYAMESIPVRFDQGEPRMARIEPLQAPAAEAQQTDVLTIETIRRAVLQLRVQDEQRRLEADQAIRLYRTGLVTFGGYRAAAYGMFDPLRQLTPEERAERQQRERAAARERANTLLTEKLTPEQRATWAEKRYVEARGSQTKRLYRIHDRGDHTYSMNVDCPAAGYTYCAYPENAYDLPMADVVLAQLLWLTTDEPGFLRLANTSPYRGSDSARHQPGWVDERRQNTGVYLDGILGWEHPVWAQPRNNQGQYVVWNRAPNEDRGILDAMMARREPIRRPMVTGGGVEAWIPDGCVERGCVLERVNHPWRGDEVRHNGAVVLRMNDGARVGLSAREIRRSLEHRLHRA